MNDILAWPTAFYTRTSCLALSVLSYDLCHIHITSLSVLMLYAPVLIFTSGSSGLLGRLRCGLSIWLSLLAIFNTLSGVYAKLFHEKNGQSRKIVQVREWPRRPHKHSLLICTFILKCFFVQQETFIAHRQRFPQLRQTQYMSEEGRGREIATTVAFPL